MIIHDGMTMRISPSLLVGAACALLSITAYAQQSYITFKGTTSPDKRWCLGWGVGGQPIDPAKADKLIMESDFFEVDNYLVDLKRKEQITTIGTQHFDSGKMKKNRGAIHAVWRKDSRLVIIEEPARFGSAHVVLVEIINPDHPHYPEVGEPIPLTKVLKRAAKEQIIKLHPEKAKDMEGATIRILPKKWVGDWKVECRVYADLPKEATVYDGTMTFTLPEMKVGVE